MEEPVKSKSSCSNGGRRRRRSMKGGMGYGFGGTIGTAGPEWNPSWGGEVTKSGQPVLEGGRRKGMSVKTLKRMLKKKGLKTTGKKATLTRRAKKARLMKGGGSVSNVGYGFDGSGARGMANAVGYPSNLPPKDFPIPK